MTILEALLLGLVQGFTEFLPVSSSGHLLLAQELLGINPPGVLLEVVVHLATAMSVTVYFRRDIAVVIKDTIRGGPGQSLGFRILVATIPAPILYLLFKTELEAALESPLVAAACLIVTGIVLLSTARARRKDTTPGLGHAVIVGCAQAIAILPGISRSGSTISAALFLGDDPDRAARFSFLLMLPVILGAGLLKGSAIEALPSDQILPLAVAALVAFVSGLAATHALLTLVVRGRLSWFGPYCLLVGVVALVWLSL